MRYWHSGYNPNIVLSSEEIQYISQFISQAYNPMQFRRAEPFNFPELVILPIDPYHLHAYWRITGSDVFVREKAAPLILRLFWKLNPAENADTRFSWVDIAEVSEQADARIKLPVFGAVYTAAIGHCDNTGSFLAYVRSQSIMMPACISASSVTELMLAEASSVVGEDDIDETFRQDIKALNDMAALDQSRYSLPISKPMMTEWAGQKNLGDYSSAGAFRLQCGANYQIGN